MQGIEGEFLQHVSFGSGNGSQPSCWHTWIERFAPTSRRLIIPFGTRVLGEDCAAENGEAVLSVVDGKYSLVPVEAAKAPVARIAAMMEAENCMLVCRFWPSV